jgi:hypothetical protein
MAVSAGKKPKIDKVGLSYMLLGEARQGQNELPAKDPTQVKEWFYVAPHVMLIVPDKDQAALRGINQDMANGLPYTTILNPKAGVALWVIPIVKPGERIEAVTPEQTHLASH